MKCFTHSTVFSVRFHSYLGGGKIIFDVVYMYDVDVVYAYVIFSRYVYYFASVSVRHCLGLELYEYIYATHSHLLGMRDCIEGQSSL